MVLHNVVDGIRLVTLQASEEGQSGAGVVVVRKLLMVFFLHYPAHLDNVEELTDDCLLVLSIKA